MVSIPDKQSAIFCCSFLSKITGICISEKSVLLIIGNVELANPDFIEGVFCSNE